MKNNSCRIKGGTDMNRQDFYDGKLFDAYRYMGAHKDGDKIRFVTYAPRASRISIIGEFNNWNEEFMEQDAQSGFFLFYSDKAKEGQMYKYCIYGPDGNRQEHCDPYGFEMELRPGACSIIRDITTYQFHDDSWMQMRSVGMEDAVNVYEMHMGSWRMNEKDENGWYQYDEIAEMLVPYLKKNNYTHVELMPLSEHPFDGSWGYQNTGFFAPTKRYGTPDKLMKFVDMMHQAGIGVIMDFVPVHFAVDGYGLKLYDGTPLYEYDNKDTGESEWGSCNFIHSRREVQCFLQSAANYWLEEYHFDGFRFDGVTSMLYYSHGLGEAFCNYGDYFNGHQDDNAICYLTLANRLIHQVNAKAITIAEEVSGMPGLAAKYEDGGYGFDYRMAMNIPDYWIKTIKEKIDEDWKPSSMFWEVTNRRKDEKTISYAESHDQALVGDKTIIFRLIDADMYWHMQKGDENYTVNRGISLHKMIRLLTATTINGGYLNFMGNEFGHPEWIDFPREGNGWSCKYARRQWNLVDNKNLAYHYMGDFDAAMLEVVKSIKNFQATPVQEIWHNDGDQVLAYMRKDLIFVFNFNPKQSFTDYGFLVPAGTYEVILNTDNPDYGGNGLTDDTIKHFTIHDPLYKKDKKEWLKLYIPARTAVVLRRTK